MDSFPDDGNLLNLQPVLLAVNLFRTRAANHNPSRLQSYLDESMARFSNAQDLITNRKFFKRGALAFLTELLSLQRGIQLVCLGRKRPSSWGLGGRSLLACLLGCLRCL